MRLLKGHVVMARKKRKLKGVKLGPIIDILPPLAAGPVLLTVSALVLAGGRPKVGVMLLCISYLALSMLYGFAILSKRRKNEVREQKQNIAYDAMSGTLYYQRMPTFMVNEEGVVDWSNAAANELFESRDIYGMYFDDISPYTFASIISANKDSPEIIIGNRKFEIMHHEFSHNGETEYILVFNDITKTDIWKTRFERAQICVAVILIDNLAELSAQSGNGEYRDAANIVDRLLKEWAESIGGIIKEISSDRYIMIFHNFYLESQKNNKFDILNVIAHAQEDRFSLPLTVSMGVSPYVDSLEECEKEAVIALDNALQRGGAQVALRQGSGSYLFFGGRSKTSQKRTSIRSRIEADRLIALIGSSDNVIVMGHANPDYDAIGACIGLARLAQTYGKPVLIVTNRHCENFKVCTERLMASDEDGYYSDLFADTERGLDALGSNTLVILTDVNNVDRCESPHIASNCAKLAVIDHHRRGGSAPIDPPELNYIDPSASSACEIVSEMLDYSPVRVGLSAEEANVMMSGIMLDTQNFVKSVGTRTFSAALYLRNAGASNEIASTYFYESINDYTVQSKLTEKIKIYRGKYIIARGVIDENDNPRVTISKLANKLLTLKRIEATFVVAHAGDTIYISARSSGKINVQLILEAVGGGGHFDSAGATIEGETLLTALERLQKAIDDYEENRV